MGRHHEGVLRRGRLLPPRRYFAASAASYDEESRVRSVVSGRENQTAAVQSFCTYDDLDRVSKRFTKQMTGSTGVTKLTTTISRKSGSDQVTSLKQDSAGYDVTYSYTYNDDGYIAEVSHGTNPTRYTYDGAGQLIREDNKVAGKTWTWSYDAAGNILSKSTYAYTVEDTLGTATATVSYGYGNANWGDLLTSYNGTAISYDNVGNPTSYRGNDCTWINGRELAGFGAWNFTYDADGLRTSRAKGTATVYEYTYVDGVLTKMTVGSNTLRFAYSVDGTPCSVNYNGTEYYYVTNAQGDVVAILDDNGTAVVTYTYDAWGNILTVGGSMADTLGVYNPLRYRGYVYDEETSLYYLQSRYYDSEMGRFINSDVLAATGQGVLGNNMFAYCGNNPVSRVDHGGNFWDTIFDVVSLCVNVAEVISDPTDVGAWVGMALDVVDVVVPCVGGLGETARAVDAAFEVADAVDDLHDTGKVVEAGWRVGDDISNLTKAENTRSWSTVRNRYWKNEAYSIREITQQITLAV